MPTWLRKCPRSARAAATFPACADAATAVVTVADMPVSATSVMMRALDGPMNGTSRSVPRATRSETSTGSADHRLRRALVAELRTLVRLEQRHVVQQAGGGHVEVGRYVPATVFELGRRFSSV